MRYHLYPSGTNNVNYIFVKKYNVNYVFIPNTKEAKFLPSKYFRPVLPLSLARSRRCSVSVSVDLTLQTEIRSGEKNRKKYGVPDVKMPERNKRWEGLNSF